MAYISSSSLTMEVSQTGLSIQDRPHLVWWFRPVELFMLVNYTSRCLKLYQRTCIFNWAVSDLFLVGFVITQTHDTVLHELECMTCQCHMFSSVHTHTHSHLHTHMYTCKHAHTHAHTHTHTSVLSVSHVFQCTHTHACMHTHTHTYTYTHTHTRTHTHTHFILFKNKQKHVQSLWENGSIVWINKDSVVTAWGSIYNIFCVIEQCTGALKKKKYPYKKRLKEATAVPVTK